MKRVLSLFLSCIFVLGVCFSTPIVASATDGGEGETETQKKLVGTEILPNESDEHKYTYKILTSTLDEDETNTCALTGYNGTETNVAISSGVVSYTYNDTVYYFTITQINSGAFSGNSTVKAITIPANVTVVEDGAFNESAVKYVFLKNDSIQVGALPEGVIVHDSSCTPLGVNDEGACNKISDSTITWYCDCGNETPCGEVALVGEDSVVYNGELHEVEPKVVGVNGLDAIPAVSYGGDGEEPINAGTYTATLTITENMELKKEFTIEPKVVSVSLSYGGEQQENLVYNGEEYFLTVFFAEDTLTEDDDYTIQYINNTNAGEITATVELTEGGNYAFLDGEELVYSKVINSGIYIAKATPTVTAPTAITGLVYNGGEQELVEEGVTTGGTMMYSLTPNDENSWSESIPKGVNADEYTVYYKVVGDDNYDSVDYNEENKVTVTIAKIPSSVATAPTANELTYTGSAQELVTAGTTTGGTMQYRLGETGDWNTEIPTGTDAGTYKVYYKVEGNENYNGVDYSENNFVEVTIAPKTIDVTLVEESYKYDGSHHILRFNFTDTVAVLVNGTDYNLAYFRGEEVTADFTNIGEIKIVVTLENTNYSFGVNNEGQQVYEKELTYTITAGVATIKTAPTVKTGLVYTGSAQELVTAGEATNGTMQYRLSENESWSTTIPSGINAKTYTVYYKVKGDLNYSDSDVASVYVAIAKATPTAENFTLTFPTNLVSNGEPKNVTVNCGADIGDVTVEYYSGETKLENAPVTPGTYTVKINVAANDNYNAASGITSNSWEFTITECTNHQWENGECTVCEIDCEHKYEDGKSAISNKVTTPATCVKEGVLFTQCKICDYELESPLDIDSDAHKMSDWTETVKATCSSTGTEESVCENEGCKHTETRATEKDADNHTYGDWVVTAATCVADGEKVKTCTNAECNHEIKETIAKDPTAHKMATEWEVTKEPTCVETGLQVKTCLNVGCDHEIEEVIAIKADAHNLGGWVVTKAAKCTIAGEITRFCKNENCEYKVTDSLDADGITHDFATEFTTVEATCILAGSKFRACLNEGCKEVTEKTEIAIDPDAHKNVETINVKQPTCEEKGYTGDEHCNDCKKTFEPGIEVDALGHTESEWIVDKEATFTEEGARHISCTVCEKELKKEVIEKRALETPVVKIENAGSGIKVSWSQDEDATGYTVYRSEYNSSTKKWSAWKNRGTAAATKKNWTDKTVKEGVTYRFTVRSVNGDRKSSYKATSGILYVVAPKVTVSITSTGLLAKWNKVNNATSYIVYRAELDADGNWGKWVQLGTTKAEKNTWSDTKVKSGVTYKYTVRAVAGKVKSGYTGSSAIIYLEQPLLKISNSANGITGKWEQVAGATGYTIYRSEYNPSIKKWTKWLNLGTAKATAKSFTDKTAKSGYQYKYTIRAINGKLKSTYQDSNKLICLAQPTLKISNVANGIQGKWNQVNGATGYIIYRSELKDGKWTKWVSLGTAKATAKSFTDKTVKSGVEYKYTVRAKNGSYKSSYIDSNTSIFLSVPTVKIANAGAGVKVSWGKIEGAKNYLVYRSEYNSSTKKWSGWKILETVDTTSFVDETAVSNVKYKYTVRALNGDYRSYYKASAELLYLKTPTVTAEKIDEGMKVSWTKIDGAKSYVIYRSELGEDGKWSKWVKLGTAGEKYTSCKDKTVKENVTYKYTVRAVNGKIMSSYVASEQILNGVVTETTPEEPKTDVVA